MNKNACLVLAGEEGMVARLMEGAAVSIFVNGDGNRDSCIGELI